jgi:Pyridoxamine 5'-phosphate oxidase
VAREHSVQREKELTMAMTGAGGRGLTQEERDDFLNSGALFAKIATTDEEGWPMVSPVWYEWDSASFLVVGKEHTSYIRNLRRDQRCGVVVENTGLPYKRVSTQCVAEFLADDFNWKTPARRMVIRYIGEEGLSYAEATFGFPRVTVRLWPKRMATWDGGGFDRTFHRDTNWHDIPLPESLAE